MRVVVAMSGGVDSSVAALLLKEQGADAVGVSMQVWDYRNNGGCLSRATCCAPDDFTDARVSASKIGIPYYVFDFEKTFKKEVIDNFVSSYQRGITPNPCIDCNAKVKFKELRERARSFGANKVATGHYAQIKESNGRLRLYRGADREKDQSYFLYSMTASELAETCFPVGHLKKSEVRRLAEIAGLPTAEKPESQDVCFVSGKNSDFIARIGKPPAGYIVSTTGKRLGGHDGIHEFTVGQRRGIRIGGLDEPLYVVEIRPETNEVVVGTKKDLERDRFFIKDFTFLYPDEKRLEGVIQVRSRHRGSPAKIEIVDGGAWVTLTHESCVIAPGQAAVFYQGDELLGGGRIGRA
jgi:tRNA-specific 2-thiouridylase